MTTEMIARYKNFILLAVAGAVLLPFTGRGIIIVDVLGGAIYLFFLAGALYLLIRFVRNSSNRGIVLGLGVAGITLKLSGFAPIEVIGLLALVYLVLRFGTKPLSQFIARLGYSVRWKFELAIAVVGALFLIVNLINIEAMDFTHRELHEIQVLGASQQSDVLSAVNILEDTNHSFFFTLIPFLGVFGVLLTAVLGAAMAWSVVDPLRRMGQGMQGIASGKFTQPIQVENRDELGELAQGINYAAQELERLQEATLAEERAHALQERMTQVTLAQEDERRRSSREMHDGLGPSLAAIGNRVRAARYLVRTDPQGTEIELDGITQSLKGHVREVRELIYDLRLLAVDQLGLLGAIKQQMERFSEQTGVEASFSMAGEVDLDPLGEVTVFRVVQECLSNIQKHADASQVEVVLQSMNTGLEVGVKGNGKGFDPSDVVAGTPVGGLGLLSMRERAELLGGSLSVQSSPGSGCRVVLYIPSREAEVGAYSNTAGG